MMHIHRMPSGLFGITCCAVFAFVASLSAASVDKELTRPAVGQNESYYKPVNFRCYKDTDMYGLAGAGKQARFYLRSGADLALDTRLAIYRLESKGQAPKRQAPKGQAPKDRASKRSIEPQTGSTTLTIDGQDYRPELIGRAAVIKVRRDGIAEAEVRSADCFSPTKGWARQAWPRRRGTRYVLSAANYTGLPKEQFDLLLTGEYWVGISRQHFSAIATEPTSQVITTTADGTKVEELTYEIPGKQYHYLFHDDVLKSYIE